MGSLLGAKGRLVGSPAARGLGFSPIPGGGGGGGGVELVGVANQHHGNAGTRTETVAFSEAATAGDLLILWAQTRNALLGVPDGGGWTEHFEIGHGGGQFANEGSNERVGLWSKVAAGGETSADMAVTDDGTDNQMFVTAIVRGAVYGDHGIELGEDGLAPSVAGVSGGILLGFWGESDDSFEGDYTGVPASMTQQVLVAGVPNDGAYACASEALTATGATGSRTAPRQGPSGIESGTLLALDPA